MATHAYRTRTPVANPPLLRAAGPCRVLTDAEVLALVGEAPPLLPGPRAFELLETGEHTASRHPWMSCPPSAEFHDHLAKLGEPVSEALSAASASYREKTGLLGEPVRHGGAPNGFKIPEENVETLLAGNTLPPPAPLPSLTAAFSRRRAISGAVALAATPVAVLQAATQSAAVDPFAGYHREILSLHDDINDGELTEDEANTRMDRWGAIDRLALSARPTTVSGAMACFTCARREFVQFDMHGDEAEDNRGHQLILHLVDGAMGVLRSMGGARV